MTNDLSYHATIKLIGVSPVPTSIFSSTKSTSAQVSKDVSGKILILRGAEGIFMGFSCLSPAISNPDITIIVPNEVRLSQSRKVFVGAEMKEEDLVLDNNDYLNRNDFGEHLIFIC